jgi:hypothetical protein
MKKDNIKVLVNGKEVKPIIYKKNPINKIMILKPINRVMVVLAVAVFLNVINTGLYFMYGTWNYLYTGLIWGILITIFILD